MILEENLKFFKFNIKAEKIFIFYQLTKKINPNPKNYFLNIVADLGNFLRFSRRFLQNL